MGKILKLLFLIVVVGLIAAGVVYARDWYAANVGGGSTETPTPEEITWGDVPALLQSGKVRQVTQLHNLTVYITLDDGTRHEVTEPRIDAIFRELDACGASCEDIIVATE